MNRLGARSENTWRTRLEEVGIRHYFTVPGDFNLVLLDQLLKNPRLKLIGCCNELNAGYAAEGYARSNGIGALVVTYSVGGLSALNAVACAYAEDLPVIAIVGGINTESEPEGQLIHHALGEVRYDYQRQIYAHVTAGAFAVRHLDEAPAVIDRAIDTALRHRKPVYLEIPCNLASLSVTVPTPRGFAAGQRSDPISLASAVEHAADLLARASKPVLVAGSRLRPPEARAAFRKLADASGYAVAVLPAAKGMFPEDHPAYHRHLLGAGQLPRCRRDGRVGRRLPVRRCHPLGLRDRGLLGPDRSQEDAAGESQRCPPA